MNIFRPVMGTDSKILDAMYQEGNVYFATDSKKIYLDAEGKNKISMGGNSSIFYGKMKLDEPPTENQKEFVFSIFDIEGNEEGHFNIPNEDDLILNNDGCFYRVKSIRGEGESTVIQTEKLTIAGSGSGDGPSDSNKTGNMTLQRITDQSVITLHGNEYSIGFNAHAWNYDNETTKNGTYRVVVNGIEVKKGTAIQKQDTYIPVHEYLELGLEGGNDIYVYVTMDIGGSSPITRSLYFNIDVTEMNLEWDYDYTRPDSIHYVDQPFITTYTISGNDIQKTAWLQIDDLPPINLGTSTSSAERTLKLSVEEIQAYNLNHGSHVFKLWATTEVNGTNTTPPIYKNIAFIGYNEDGSVNNTPVINCGLFNTDLIQYNTSYIPINIYSAANGAGTATVILFENGEEVDRWNDVKNLEEHIWSYTPTNSGINSLKVQCGIASVNFVINVTKLDMGKTEEAPNYTFKFKASDFASNSAVQNWDSNGVKATFNNFDWINGGLKTEIDDSGNSRQYVAIKAGSTMDINYPLWSKNAPASGKVLKIIFKATNCRDYDARILSCKKDKKIVQEDNIPQSFYIETGSILTYADNLSFNKEEQTLSLKEDTLHDIVFTLTDKQVADTLNGKYAQLEDGKVYRCYLTKTKESTEQNPQYSINWYLMYITDSFDGIVLNAQNAIVNTNMSNLDTQYCEDTYIELELDITKYDQNKIKNYIKFWVDGIPSGYTTYSSSDAFDNPGETKITIGSLDCDVYIYMIKLYEYELTTDQHINNFILDAPNAVEMMKRYNRNNILNADRKIIDPVLLSQANPDCLVHVYEIPRIPIKKKDKVSGCTYTQYHNSKTPILRAENVMIKVQGTSSERYVVAAANLDSDFNFMDTADQYPPSGFIDVATGQKLEGWKMNENSIPINFTCTKVNVASCENANNALNQEWYNMFQPYKSVLRCKNPKARDTMEFTNGVLFMIDHHNKFDTSSGTPEENNVFGELGAAYWNNPYPRFYSLGQMGNSKDNIHVFHDQDNPYECCIEVKDNQELQQKMISDQYNRADIGEGEGYFEFRYPDGVSEASQDMIKGWNRLVQWMSHSNPQSKYTKHKVLNEKEFLLASTNLNTMQSIPIYILNEDKTAYIPIDHYDSNIEDYFTETVHVYGYTNLPLPDYSLSYDLMVENNKKYYKKVNNDYILVEDISSIVSPVDEGLYEETKKTFDAYKFKGYKCEEQINPETNEIWQKNYNPIVANITIDTYQGSYTHDTYEYRIAKMLYECENYLVMDSIIYHYLFIERHSMIDNVAKNTFWSTEDCKHWNLIKDYDNDTADGNDNNGKLTIPYGMEVLDKIKGVTDVFNASESVWLHFCHGIEDACRQFYQLISAKTFNYKGRTLSIWNKDDYLWFFEQWQNVIPERCWIEDYYRKYFRPNEIYGKSMFNDMIQGGQKKHQRKQYETYQDIYISSKYMNNETNRLYFRPRGENLSGLSIPVQTYSDCYVYMDVGSAHSHERVKRNTILRLPIPAEDLSNATMDLRPGNIFTVVGEEDGPGQLNAISPDQIEINNGKKLRKIVFGSNKYENAPTYNQNTSLSKLKIDNPLLEELHIANIGSVTCDLDLSKSPNLLYLDAEKSGFTDIIIADKAPITDIYLNSPKGLTLSNLTDLEKLEINNYSNIERVRFDNLDGGAINTKDIIQSIIDADIDPDLAFRYTLKNIDWTIDNASEIQDNKILILEYLLTPPNRPNPNETTFENEPTTTSLTGEITITANAYNGTESFEIYNKYINDIVYPLVELKFLGDQAKLYKVNVFDGNKNIYWKRCITPGGNIDAEFLKAGPNGAFNPDGFYKADDAENTYEFTNNWFVYQTSDFSDTPIMINDSQYPLLNNIQNDVYIVPEFHEETKMYTLEFFNEGEDEPFYVTQREYQTPYLDFIPQDIPYKAPNADDGVKAGYDFKGYSLIKNSDIIVTEQFTVSENQQFFAVFKHYDDLTEIIHEDWFEWGSDNYGNEALIPASGKTLSGKVVMPSIFKGKKVTRIGNFANSKITHLLCAKDSQLEVISETAFQNNKDLIYFDFSQNTVTKIESKAFQSCTNLDPDVFELSNKLSIVEEYGFAGAFQSKKAIIKIPASVKTIGQRGFNNLNLMMYGNSTLQIGDEENYSELKFDGNVIGNSNPFKQNEKQFTDFIFYSKYYNSFEDLVNNNQLYQYFIATTIDSKPNIYNIQISNPEEFQQAKAAYDVIYTIIQKDPTKIGDYSFVEIEEYSGKDETNYYYGKDFTEIELIDQVAYELASQKHTLFILDTTFSINNPTFALSTAYEEGRRTYFYDNDESLNDEFVLNGYQFTIHREGN